jgi:hypothetical protein
LQSGVARGSFEAPRAREPVRSACTVKVVRDLRRVWK